MYLFTNHYEVLGVAETATPEEAREAYREWVRRTHPGPEFVAGNEARQLARDVLCDPTRRAAFDRELTDERDLLGSVRGPRISMTVSAPPPPGATSRAQYATARPRPAASATARPAPAGPATAPSASALGGGQGQLDVANAVPSSPVSHKIVAASMALALLIPTVVIGLDLWGAAPGEFTAAWHTPAFLALAAVAWLGTFRAVVVLSGYRGFLDWSEWSLHVGRSAFTMAVSGAIIGGVGYAAATAQTLAERRYLSEAAIGVAITALLVVCLRVLRED